jgi:hypothetical protein
MITSKLKAIKLLRNSFYVLPLVIFLVVVFHFNIDVRAHQVTLFVESGNVEMKNIFEDDSEFRQVASRYINITRNTVVRTNQGTAYILLPGKSLISIDSFSSVSFDAVTRTSFSITSSYGRTWHKINDSLPTNRFTYELKTPTAHLAGVGAEFELNVDNNEDVVSKVTLLEGEALVTNSRSQYLKTVNEGNLARVSKGADDVKVEQFSDDSIDSEFYRKNKIVKEEIEKVDPNAPLESYKVAIEQASSTVISSFSENKGDEGESSSTVPSDEQTDSSQTQGASGENTNSPSNNGATAQPVDETNNSNENEGSESNPQTSDNTTNGNDVDGVNGQGTGNNDTPNPAVVTPQSEEPETVDTNTTDETTSDDAPTESIQEIDNTVGSDSAAAVVGFFEEEFPEVVEEIIVE